MANFNVVETGKKNGRVMSSVFLNGFEMVSDLGREEATQFCLANMTYEDTYSKNGNKKISYLQFLIYHCLDVAFVTDNRRVMNMLKQIMKELE